MQQMPCTAASYAAAATAASVLRDHSLVAHVASFQPGLPQLFHELLTQYIAKFPEHMRRSVVAPSRLWRVVMRDCELRLVQKLCFLKSQSEYASDQQVQTVDVPVCAAMLGRLDVLQWLEAKRTPTDESWSAELLYHAMGARHYDMAKWLLAHHPTSCVEKFEINLKIAVGSRDFELFQMMVAFKPATLTPEITDHAAASGNMEVMLYLHERGVSCTTAAMDFAARTGRIEMVKFLHTHRTEGCTTKAMDKAAENGHLEVVRFLHEQRIEGCTSRALDAAATCGHLDVVRFLHENRSEGCTTLAIDGAARNGHFEIIKFLQANRTEGCTENALVQAAEWGHLDILKFLYESDKVQIKGGYQLISKAFCSGYFEVAMYLRDVVRVPFSQSELDRAASSGNLELVKILHQNRKERSTELALLRAAQSGKTEIIDYLLAHRDEPVSQPLVDGATDHLELLKRLHKKFGSKVTIDYMRRLIYWGKHEVIRYAHEAMDVPLVEDALECAASDGHLDLIKYILEKTGGGNVYEVIRRAKYRGHHDVVAYLEALGGEYYW